MELTLYRLEFEVDKKTRRFTVFNNVEQLGFTMENIFDDWISHSAEITAENFCKFIRSKDRNIVCFTEEEYNEQFAE